MIMFGVANMPSPVFTIGTSTAVVLQANVYKKQSVLEQASY